MKHTGIVYWNNLEAGTITQDEHGFHFSYSPDYLAGESPRAISLTLPLSPEPYDSLTMFSFFDGLIPEGWLLDVVTQTWKIDPRDRMMLLLSCCRDCIGAVSVMPPEASHETL